MGCGTAKHPHRSEEGSAARSVTTTVNRSCSRPAAARVGVQDRTTPRTLRNAGGTPLRGSRRERLPKRPPVSCSRPTSLRDVVLPGVVPLSAPRPRPCRHPRAAGPRHVQRESVPLPHARGLPCGDMADQEPGTGSAARPGSAPNGRISRGRVQRFDMPLARSYPICDCDLMWTLPGHWVRQATGNGLLVGLGSFGQGRPGTSVRRRPWAFVCVVALCAANTLLTDDLEAGPTDLGTDL